MRVRRRRLLAGAVVATAAATGAAAVASSRDGARGGTRGGTMAGDRAPADGRPRPGLAGLLELCATSRVVALTEGMHGSQDVYDLLAVAMLQPAFSIVDSIVVEWGNSLHQGVTDDYVNGALVSMSRLQRIWRDTTQSPMNPLEHPTNFRLLSLARAANLFGARPRPLRVLLADPPIDWAGINDRTDYERFAGDHSRTDSWARVILDEVLAKGERCITIGGGFHLLRRGYELAGLDLPNVTDQVARRAPSGVSVIHTHASTMVGERIEEHLSGWPRPSIAEAAHTSMGAVPAVDAAEFALWISPHILDNTARVLVEGLKWPADRVEEYLTVLLEVADHSGGGIVDPPAVVTDGRDHEDNRILDLVVEVGALLVVSEDTDLTSMSPWRGTPILRPREFAAKVDGMRRHRRR